MSFTGHSEAESHMQELRSFLRKIEQAEAHAPDLELVSKFLGEPPHMISVSDSNDIMVGALMSFVLTWKACLMKQPT